MRCASVPRCPTTRYFRSPPLLTLAVALAALVADEDAVQVELRGQFESLVGKPGAEAMAHMLRSASHPVHGTIATLVSLATLLVVSMGMFSELQDSLNLIWRGNFLCQRAWN